VEETAEKSKENISICWSIFRLGNLLKFILKLINILKTVKRPLMMILISFRMITRQIIS
jgi:hypothetical protein